MKFQSFLVTAALALSLAFTPAAASDCGVDAYNHNGSTMEVQTCGGDLSISYVQPRQGLVRHGVQNGTLLFSGIEGPAGWITGQARLFNDLCGEIVYAVAGPIRRGSIELTGDAPVRSRNCQVTGHRPDRLVFTLQTAAPQAPPHAPTTVSPSCPTGYVFSHGQCVRSGGPAQLPPLAAGPQTGGPGTPQAPPPSAPGPVGDYYAIAGSFKARHQAEARAGQLGFGWTVINTSQCPNFTRGYWIATAGPFSQAEAQAYADGAQQGAYVKRCH